jgi:ABC-2 type transport system permease protein
MRMFSVQRFITDVKYGLIQYFRSRQSIIFSFMMPVLFLILGWFLFGVPVDTAYIDYLMPGILGIAVMGSAIDLTVGVIAGHRSTGLMKKIVTTPISSLEWNLSRATIGLAVALLSVAGTLLAAWVMFGYIPVINVIAISLVAAGSVMSVGMGMLIAYAIKDREAANMAAFTITFPLILISGSIFPAEQLPALLRTIVDVSPLTYLNSGLRSAMAMGNTGDALADLAIVCVMAVVLFGIGMTAAKWRE